MSNFFDSVVEVLKQDERFFTAEGELLRNAVYEAAMQMDAKLIKMLLENAETKARFFTDVDGIAVFDKVGFGWVINNREFLPDSYGWNMKNKIIIVDLDGTVLHSDESITNYTIDTIKMCQRRGAKIVVATSRSRKSAKKYCDLLTPDALITCGGAIAVVGDKIIHEALLDSKLAKTYIKKCLSLNGVDFIRVSGELEDYTNNPQLISGEMEYGHYKKTSFDLTVEQRVEKITICSKNITEVEKIFGCDSHCALVLSYAGECFHKLTHAEATKESALKKILSYWGSNNEYCIAFGNDDADINMLLMCGIGVAVRNATKKLKSIADIICEDNDNDGVASYLMEYYSQLKAK